MMVGDMAITCGSTKPHKKLFQPLRHANFLGCVFSKCIIKKTAEL